MSALAALLDVFYPPRCGACGELFAVERERALPLCRTCEETLDPIDRCCDVCGLPGEASPCAACVASPPPFHRARARFLYGAAIAELLHRFKYNDRSELARPLGRQLAALALDAPDVVAPVPLHPSRRRSRTFDQALYLARVLSAERRWRLDTTLLARVRATGRQVGRHRDERARNVAGAFVVGGDVQGKSVLLVDDVVTTGATAAECARVLVDAGAKRVQVAAVARAA